MLIGNYFKKINSEYKNHFFSGLSFNSSSCKKNNIFFAIKGNKTDGGQYINSAIKNGATTIVYNKNFQGIKDKVLFIKVENVRKSLAKISYKIYKKKPKNLIAITGTNGKSSIAEFYFQILKLNKIKVASIGTLGIKTVLKNIKVSNTTLDPIKLAYYLKKLKKQKIENVILEASSHGLKQNRLDGLKFKTAIFTNLTHDHLDYHKSFQDYLNSKLYLFKKLLKKDSNIITDLTIPEFKKIKKISLINKLNLITIGNEKSNLDIISHKYLNEKQVVKIEYKNIFYNFETKLIGKIQIKNILMAILAAEKSHIKMKDIVRVINKIKPVNGRLEEIGKIKNNSKAILDYAHTPDALKMSLKNLKNQFKDKKISIVFGCGGDRDKWKRSKMGKIANQYCDKIYLTDDNPRIESPKIIRANIKSQINKSKLYEIPNREKAISEGIKNLSTGEILLVAGKGHETIQDYGKFKKFFSDKQCILKKIKIKNKRLFKDIKLNILIEESKQKNFLNKKKLNMASINSKAIKKNDIFFAIKGKKNDGNNYLEEVFKRGASLAVVNKINKSFKPTSQIKVQDSLKFLTKVSNIVRENSKGKIIAITGSCGKTSLKELLGITLNKFSKITYSPSSFNNKFGVPLSLFNLREKDDFGVFEVGMDKKGEIDNLTKIIQPDIGVITNISYAHAKNFKNIKQIALAKAEIINNIKEGGSLVLNADDKFYKLLNKIATKKKIKVYSFSLKKKTASTQLNYLLKYKSKFKISINVGNQKKYFFIKSNFENNIQNLLAAITVISIFKNIKELSSNIFYNVKILAGRGDISKLKIKKKIFF